MQCRNCDYMLFNLPEPRCPECNTPFDVTTYTFDPGAVQFGCPVCDQLYQGNDERGLRSPRRFTCVNCHQPIDASSMRVVPVTPEAMGVADVGPGLPWERSNGAGLLSRWWATCKLGMFQPRNYYRQLRHVEDLGKAVSFAAVCLIFSGVLSGLIDGGVSLAIGQAATGAAGQPAGGLFTTTPGQMLIEVILSVPAGILGLFLGGAMVHIGVRILARGRREYRSTVVVLAYATCPAVWALIPILGSAIAGIWGLVVGIVGISVIHRTTIGRAVAAYFALGLIIMLSVCLIFAVAIAFL